jgi:hypothetical protein
LAGQRRWTASCIADEPAAAFIPSREFDSRNTGKVEVGAFVHASDGLVLEAFHVSEMVIQECFSLILWYSGVRQRLKLGIIRRGDDEVAREAFALVVDWSEPDDSSFVAMLQARVGLS